MHFELVDSIFTHAIDTDDAGEVPAVKLMKSSILVMNKHGIVQINRAGGAAMAQWAFMIRRWLQLGGFGAMIPTIFCSKCGSLIIQVERFFGLGPYTF
jgi:hypothetical protein